MSPIGDWPPPLIRPPVGENAGSASHAYGSGSRPRVCVSEKTKAVLFFFRWLSRRPLAGGAGRMLSSGEGRKNLEESEIRFSACKSLISHKTDEGIFGNIWRKRPQFWKCLAWACKGLEGPRIGEEDGALRRAHALAIAWPRQPFKRKPHDTQICDFALQNAARA